MFPPGGSMEMLRSDVSTMYSRAAAYVPTRQLLDEHLVDYVLRNMKEPQEPTHDASETKAREALPEALIPVQEWEGYVVDIGSTDFIGRLLDITRGDKYDSEEVVISLEELSEEDAATIKLGGVFRLVVGYNVSATGEKTDVSRVVFRDLPRVTEEDLEEGRKWADEVLRAFET